MSAAMTDAELVAAYVAGDQAAGGELFTRFQPFMRAAVRRSGGAPRDVDDLVSETTIRMLRSAHTWDPSRASFGTWLYVVARRVTHSHNQREQRQVSTVGLNNERRRTRASIGRAPEEGDMFVLTASDGDDPPADVDTAAQVEAAVDCAAVFERLPGFHREVLWLTHVEGHTTREAAEQMRCAPGSVKSRTSRALAHARVVAGAPR